MKNEFQVYLRLLAYLKPYWGYAILVLIGFALSAGTEVSIAKLLEFILKAIQEQNHHETSIFPLLVILLIFVRGVASFLGDYYSAVISRHLVFNIRQEAFSKLLYLPSSYYSAHSSGQITSKILYNIEQLTAASSDSVQIMVKEGFIVIGLLSYLFYLNWRLTLIILAVAPIIGWVVRSAAKKMRKLSTEMQNTMGDVNHVVQEAILGQSIIKGFSAQEAERKRFFYHSEKNLKKGLKLHIINVLNTPIVQLLMAFSMAIIMWIALRPSVLEGVTSAQFVSYIVAAGMLSKPIKNLTTVNEKLQRGLAAAHSVFELLDLPTETDSGIQKPKITGAVKFDLVNIVYQDGKCAVKDFTLDVKAGETIALVGRSGAGKTSLVNLLMRLQDITSGKIYFDDVSIQDIELNYLRQHVAMVNQQVVIFDRSIRENIAYGITQEATEDEIIAAAKAAYAHDFIMSLPNGYDTMLGSEGIALSGGQRQRISIARAILKNAPILILDEATSALDNESEFFIQKAFERAQHNRTTFVIAHRLSTVENAHRIVVMDQGEIIEVGSHEQLMQQQGAYSRLYHREFVE
ncbi:lipid A export permease/ATP-binding protein MsbA [Acinetobacter qingfengensis]|uniref:Lipid A export permease/ATP-binding protein MsbA n=1 Tax=Acinetobacter qingfengensis TaxID=1262585 RepID=A0A1E7RF73_9GAMM|nr:lipid A export permease/ATP-binding protein MsbA [Acinetobacter qingfengensis]KAA8735652.1 lipid A export permease/ATP-binding protein MsbA [Acinetobacter qingfengensis]OEY97902.1 lipid A export permease/ATP-binding protein MsbA [Acinetobacter qingfengensis]